MYLIKSVAELVDSCKRKQVLLSGMLIVLLASCQTNSPKPLQKPPVIVTEYKTTEVICADVPELDSQKWLEIEFIVATDEDGLKVIGISEENYRKLAHNTQLALKSIKDRNSVIIYLKECIRKHNERIE